MEQMNLQELMDLVIVMELFTTLLKMLDPVETCILNLRRNALLHSTAHYIINERTRGVDAIDILLEVRHTLYTAIGQREMRLLLIHLEFWITTPSFVK